jgi:arylsulfatase A-like enzyme
MAEMTGSVKPRSSPHRVLGLFGTLVLILVGLSVVLHVLPRVEQGGIQHVIVISLDTARADHFGCYGNTWIQTPNIDALAKESILFTDYLTTVSTTLASHVSLFAGKYPHTHGTPRNGFIVNADNEMLAEILKEAGFTTAAFLGSFALHSRFGFDQGFGHFDQEFDILRLRGRIDQNQRRAAAVTDAVVAHLDQQGIPSRLFLFVHYFDPHFPYDPPPPYDTMYGDAPGAIALEDHPVLTCGEDLIDSRRSLELYAGEVSYMDFHVGRLLDELRRRGILDQALVLVTSDHGENPGDKRGKPFHHGRTVYQSEMHCVGLIRLPGAAHGGMRCELPLSSIDMLPTVVSQLGLPIPAGVEGEALDLANPGQSFLSRPRFGEASKPYKEESDPAWFNNTKPRCIREGPFKYIQTRYQSREELYDLRTDPHERANLLDYPGTEFATRAADLRRKLEAWTAAQNPLPSHFDGRNPDETIARLRALGYLDDDEQDDSGDAELP